MNHPSSFISSLSSRRRFLKTTGSAAAGVAIAGALSRPAYAADENTLKIALVGCGGRGTGAAAQALSTAGPTQLWAVADVFDDRLQGSLKQLKQQHPETTAVPKDRQFVGMDAYQQAIDSLGKGGVVLLATPPAFRPIHVEYAINQGCHVFMEKSFAVDAPGIRRIVKAGEMADQKGLKIAGGLMSRHYPPLEEAVAQIHDGLIGDVITAWAYRMHGPVGVRPRSSDMTELAYQIANYSCFTWLNGSFMVDWLIHNIDICCWVKDAWPVSVQGMGGRETREDADQLFDHYFAEYTFPDGTKLATQGRHINNCWGFFGDQIQGAKGCAVLGEGIPKPRIYRGHNAEPAEQIWDYRGPARDAYQVEHDLFFEAIRENKPYNESKRCAKACFTAIMGRMACESGKMISWDEAYGSELSLAPDLEQIRSLQDTAPVVPDATGHYPVAVPGRAVVI